MKQDMFLCWTDTAGKRGYTRLEDMQMLKQIATGVYLLEATTTTAVIKTPDDNLFYISDPYKAIEWVTNGTKDCAVVRPPN